MYCLLARTSASTGTHIRSFGDILSRHDVQQVQQQARFHHVRGSIKVGTIPWCWVLVLGARLHNSLRQTHQTRTCTVPHTRQPVQRGAHGAVARQVRTRVKRHVSNKNKPSRPCGCDDSNRAPCTPPLSLLPTRLPRLRFRDDCASAWRSGALSKSPYTSAMRRRLASRIASICVLP